MKTNVTVYEFMDAFEKCGRGESFTREGFEALYENLIEYEESCETELELDPIGFDCDFTEYKDLEEFHANYDKEDYPDIESIEENTTVIKIDGESFIIQNF